RGADLRAYVTSGLDGALARAAALALAAALPEPLPACGLATGALLADDLACGPEPKDGELDVSSAPGLGLAPDPCALQALATGETREVVRSGGCRSGSRRAPRSRPTPRRFAAARSTGPSPSSTVRRGAPPRRCARAASSPATGSPCCFRTARSSS